MRPLSRPLPRLCPLIRPSCDYCPDHFPDFALWSDHSATIVQTTSQTLPSDQTVVRPLSRPFSRLCTLIRPSCDHCPHHFPHFALWSDRSATIVQTIVRLKRFPDHVIWVAPRHRCATQMVWSERSRVAHLNLGGMCFLAMKRKSKTKQNAIYSWSKKSSCWVQIPKASQPSIQSARR